MSQLKRFSVWRATSMVTESASRWRPSHLGAGRPWRTRDAPASCPWPISKVFLASLERLILLHVVSFLSLSLSLSLSLILPIFFLVGPFFPFCWAPLGLHPSCSGWTSFRGCWADDDSLITGRSRLLFHVHEYVYELMNGPEPAIGFENAIKLGTTR